MLCRGASALSMVNDEEWLKTLQLCGAMDWTVDTALDWLELSCYWSNYR